MNLFNIYIYIYIYIQDPHSNPYGLTEGLTYYHLEVENWKTNRHRKHSSKKSIKSSTTKGKEPENVTSPMLTSSPSSPSASASAFSKSYTTSLPDTGLASISTPPITDTQRDHNTNNNNYDNTHNNISSTMTSPSSSPSASLSNNLVRPSFPASLSTSSIVHSYIPLSSSPNSASVAAERRHSIGFFTPQQQQQQSPPPQQLPVDSTMMWTQAPQ